MFFHLLSKKITREYCNQVTFRRETMFIPYHDSDWLNGYLPLHPKLTRNFCYCLQFQSTEKKLKSYFYIYIKVINSDFAWGCNHVVPIDRWRQKIIWSFCSVSAIIWFSIGLLYKLINSSVPVVAFWESNNLPSRELKLFFTNICIGFSQLITPKWSC